MYFEKSITTATLTVWLERAVPQQVISAGQIATS